jgi:hypothetical protein
MRRRYLRRNPAFEMTPARGLPEQTRPDLSGLVFMGLVINPKTKRPVLATTDGDYVGIRSIEQANVLEQLGRGYHSSSYEAAEKATGYPRVHTPEGVGKKGQGYGTTLYTALCLGAELAWEEKIEISMTGSGRGISSDSEDRSAAASRWWEAAHDRGLTDQEVVEGESEREEYVKLDVSPSELEGCLTGVEGEITYVNEVNVDIEKPAEDRTFDYYTYKSATEHKLIPLSFALEIPRMPSGAELRYVWKEIFDDPDRLISYDWTALLALDVRDLDIDIVNLLSLAYIAAGGRDKDVDDLWYRWKHGLDPDVVSPQERLFRANAAGLVSVADARDEAGWTALSGLP